MGSTGDLLIMGSLALQLDALVDAVRHTFHGTANFGPIHRVPFLGQNALQTIDRRHISLFHLPIEVGPDVLHWIKVRRIGWM